MDNYTKYLEEGTNHLLEVISQQDMDKEGAEAIITAFTEELYKGVCNTDKMSDYEPLIFGELLAYTDSQLSKLLLFQDISSEVANKAISLCDKKESLLKLFKEKGWMVPQISNDSIDHCRAIINKRKESTYIQAKMIDEDNKINDLLCQAERNLNIGICSTIEGILLELEKDIAVCRHKSIELPNISNLDIQNTKRRIECLKQLAAEKNKLYTRIIDGDKHIDVAVTSLVTSESDCQAIISLCQNQQQLIEQCGTRRWAVPSVKYSKPITMVNMYSHYQEMIKLDGVLATQLSELRTSKQYKDFFANCEKQKNNVGICCNNGWGIPQLSTGNPGTLLDKIHIEKRKKDITKSIKQKLIGAAVIVVSLFTFVIFCVKKYREGKVQIPVETSYAVGLEYTELKEIFEEAGFENIRVVAEETGWGESGTVRTVLIDGKDTFNKDAYVKPDVIVEIRYSSLDRVDISQYLEDWQNREYGDIKTVLQNNKFSDITLNPIDTSEKAQDKKICGLNLNGQTYTNGRCYLQLNSPIEISYYTLKISIASSNAQYIGQDYIKVVDSLKEDGFTNVQTEEVKTGWAKGNSVIAVMINNTSAFDIGETYNPGIKIVVKYSSNDRVKLTNRFKDWKSTNYSTVLNALTSAGFTNVTSVPKDTSEKSQNQMIAGLTFNGEAYVGGECFLQKSAPIVIYYYNLKIKPGKAVEDYVANTTGYYSTVVNRLKALGFTNIKVFRKNDLINGWVTKEGSVDSISINGNNNFTATDTFNYDAEIVILVHTFNGEGCEDITLIAE